MTPWSSFILGFEIFFSSLWSRMSRVSVKVQAKCQLLSWNCPQLAIPSAVALCSTVCVILVAIIPLCPGGEPLVTFWSLRLASEAGSHLLCIAYIWDSENGWVRDSSSILLKFTLGTQQFYGLNITFFILFRLLLSFFFSVLPFHTPFFSLWDIFQKFASSSLNTGVNLDRSVSLLIYWS